MKTRWPDAVAAGESGYEQIALPGFIDEAYLNTEELLAQALRMKPSLVFAYGRRKRIALAASRVAVDFGAFMGAMWVAYYVRFENGYIMSRFTPENVPGLAAVFLTVLVGFPLLVAFLQMSGMYRSNVRIRALDRLPKIITAVNALIIAQLLLLFLLNVKGSFRGYTAFFWLFSILFLFLGRMILQGGLAIAGVNDVVERNTLIVGSGQIGKCMALKLMRHPEAGLKPIGFLDDDPLFTKFDEQELKDLRVLGRLDQLPDIAREFSVEKVIIGFTSGRHEPLLELVATCNKIGLECSVLPRLFEVITDEIHVREIGGISLVPLRRKTISSVKLGLKAIEDYTLSVLGLLIFWPVLLITAIAIKLDSPGPVLYRHPRIGRDGKSFKCLKFRSMCQNADELQAVMVGETGENDWLCWKLADDPRVTRVGKWIRKFSIDEAPQVFNVLAGQMSVVGPRPHIQNEVDQYKNWHFERLNIKPGITGPWQVSGRSDIPFDEMIKLDYYYIERWSLWEDTKIILRTITAVLFRKGAY